MPVRPDSWTLDFTGGQWILSYLGCPGSSLRLYARGPVTEGTTDGEKLPALEVSGESAGFPVMAPIQVHGTTVIRAEETSCLPARPRADGLAIDRTKIAGTLQFADCLPVILCGRSPFPWVVIGHSGFAGTGRNIVSAMVAYILKTYGRQALECTTAWIGPGICRECYGRNLEDPWTEWGTKVFPREYVILKERQAYFDLPGMIENQLLELGLSESAVSRIPFCTRCRNDIFYSYRAGDRQRNFLVARLIPSGHKDGNSWENDYSSPFFFQESQFWSVIIDGAFARWRYRGRSPWLSSCKGLHGTVEYRPRRCC